jgi:hypothetical protein
VQAADLRVCTHTTTWLNFSSQCKLVAPGVVVVAVEVLDLVDAGASCVRCLEALVSKVRCLAALVSLTILAAIEALGLDEHLKHLPLLLPPHPKLLLSSPRLSSFETYLILIVVRWASEKPW